MKKTFITNGIYSLIFGGAIMLLTAGFFAALFFLPRVDNPSSTDAIAYAIAIIITIIAGIVSMGIALVTVVRVDAEVKKGNSLHSPEYLKRKRLTTIGLVIALLLFTVLVVAMISSREYNTKNTQGVKFDTGIVESIKVQPDSIKNYNPDLNDTHAIGYISNIEYDNQKEFEWNGKKFTISRLEGKDNFQVRKDDQSVLIDHSLKGYNYIIGTTYITFNHGAKSYLVVLTRLRATSHMSVLNIFSEDGKVQYEELMGRFNIVEHGEVNGEKVIVIGNKDLRYEKYHYYVLDKVYKLKK